MVSSFHQSSVSCNPSFGCNTRFQVRGLISGLIIRTEPSPRATERPAGDMLCAIRAVVKHWSAFGCVWKVALGSVGLALTIAAFWPKKAANGESGAATYRLPPSLQLPYLVVKKIVFEVPSGNESG